MFTVFGFLTKKEGIETQAQRAELLALGCDRGQGYLFSRPVTALEATAMLKAQAAANDETVQTA